MEKRRLGRTNRQVSIVGFGSTWIAELEATQAVQVVRRSFELGINYFDTAKLDGDSEEKIGEALHEVRDECVIATKTGSRTKKESLQDVKESLSRLQTNRLDIIQLHGIDDEKTLAKAISEDGSLKTCKQARREGLVDFIGITGHKPRILAKAIATGEFDTVLVPLNVVTRQALEELLPAAKAQDVGIMAMKPFFVKTSTLITCLYEPSLSLLSDEPELAALLGKDSDMRAKNALRFGLSQDVSTVVAGVKSASQAEVAARTGEQYSGLTRQEQERFSFNFQKPYCRDCGECLPCSQDINIAAILRFLMLKEVYRLPEWAKKLYSGLQGKADKCNRCEECQHRCPYHLPIIEMLQRVKKDFQ